MSQVTVYLSNTDIQVLLGRGTGKAISVKRRFTMMLPEGSVLNGVITDPVSLVDAIRHFWKQSRLPEKGIDLVVNSPQIMVRVVDVPLMNDSKTASYLRREYIEREEEQILGFYRVDCNKKAKTSKVCTEITDTEFLTSYLQVFSEAGVSLSAIYSGVGAAINLFAQTGFAKDENCVVLIRDGMTITAIFFVKGEYYYSTTSRVFSDPGTAEYAREVAKTINQIDQFSRSQKIEDPISTIYLAGMEAGDEALLSRSISDTLQNPVVVGTLMHLRGVNTTGAAQALDRIVYPVAGLMPRCGHNNILKSIKKEKSEEQLKQERLLRIYVPYVATALIMVAITVYMFALSRQRVRYLNELTDYNTNPEIKFSAIDYDVAAERVAILNQHYGGLKVLERNVNSYPVAVSQVWSVIREDAAGVGQVEITGYDASTGELSFTTSFQDVVLLNEFISRLKEENIFTNVDYKGYTEKENTTGVDEWTARLSCVLAETAGRDVVPTIVAEPKKEEAPEMPKELSEEVSE
ncbi:MAG: hypothetical protein K5739_09630 [Lachnospiraceae bacterium]|nr:hypothetical protein [Lachnospiraceae bacterium]